MKALCFVLMPFGVKADASGQLTDFDQVYEHVIRPAVEAAGLEPIRADEERIGGTIHKPMYERLILCDYAVADVTGANPNVFYELGIRHAVRPRSTVIIFREGTLLPFDIAPLRGLAYAVSDSGAPAAPSEDRDAITARLRSASAGDGDDSPLFQMIDDMPRVSINPARSDVFRERAARAGDLRDQVSAARRADGRSRAERQAAVRAVDARLFSEGAAEPESAVLLDLFIAYRDVEDFEGMLELLTRLPKPLQQIRKVREQTAFALSRLRRFDDAIAALTDLIETQGPSSETNGLLGRVHKDLWRAALAADHRLAARGHLKNAIEAYLAGFEADWRDTYPGVNAVTLMEMLDRPDPRQADLLPVVRYAARQRAGRGGGYWEHATVMEAAVLARAEEEAFDAAAAACAAAAQPWEIETTLANLREIIGARRNRGEPADWAEEIAEHLESKKARLSGGG